MTAPFAIAERSEGSAEKVRRCHPDSVNRPRQGLMIFRSGVLYQGTA
jgi:hypothetical protein